MKSVLSEYPGCAVLMDSHLPLYWRYLHLEMTFNFRTRPGRVLYGKHKYIREWQGNKEVSHPGRVIVRHYTNTILNYICTGP